MLKQFLWPLFLCLSVSGQAGAETLTLAAASDMTYCLPEVVKIFQAGHPGSEIRTVFGASGALFAQIKNGAPYDVFLSADMRYPTELIQAGAAERATLANYARGHLVLWSIDPAIQLEPGMAGLRSAAVKHIAIANPDTAPYGRAARGALEQAGLWEELKSKLVFGENIAQTLQYAESGNADVAFLSRSLVLSPRMAGKGHFQALPEGSYPPIEQGLVVTGVGARQPLASQFAAFMRSPQAREILRKFGFSTPEREHP